MKFSAPKFKPPSFVNKQKPLPHAKLAAMVAPIQGNTWLHAYLRNKVRSSSIGVKPGPMPGVVARPRGLPLIPPHASGPAQIHAPGLFTPPG